MFKYFDTRWMRWLPTAAKLPIAHSAARNVSPLRLFCLLALVGLAAYSLGLLTLEWRTSQDYVRHYVTDIVGPVRFYAVNTTLSVFLLWSTSLLFIVCLRCSCPTPKFGRLHAFYISQILVFAYLGFDDRFRVHEWLGEKFGTPDHYWLAAVAAIEIVCLLTVGRAHIQLRRAKTYLWLASTSFGVMFLVDAFAPHDGFLRLSLEDVAKVWGTLFFFLFSWNQLELALKRTQFRLGNDASAD